MSEDVMDMPILPSWPLVVGEIVHIGGIPYRYAGHGRIEGATDPAVAREMRDQPRGGTSGEAGPRNA